MTGNVKTETRKITTARDLSDKFEQSPAYQNHYNTKQESYIEWLQKVALGAIEFVYELNDSEGFGARSTEDMFVERNTFLELSPAEMVKNKPA